MQLIARVKKALRRTMDVSELSLPPGMERSEAPQNTAQVAVMRLKADSLRHG